MKGVEDWWQEASHCQRKETKVLVISFGIDYR